MMASPKLLVGISEYENPEISGFAPSVIRAVVSLVGLYYNHVHINRRLKPDSSSRELFQTDAKDVDLSQYHGPLKQQVCLMDNSI